MTACIHHIPGRVRIRIARIKGSERSASKVEHHLRSLPGIRTAVANPLTGSVLIHYDPRLTDVEQFAQGLGCAASSPQKGSGQIRGLAYLVARTIVTGLIETAIERGVIAVIAAVL